MGYIACGGLITLAVALAGATLAHAQYPIRTIRLVVPFAAGSANDVVARFVGPPLSEALGRQVVIDNRPGAAGNLGAEIAAKSAPDGYTLLLGNISHAISVALYDKLGYDFIKDFAPVSLLAAGSFMLAVHPSVPAKSVKELITLAKAQPEQLNIGLSGAGIILAAELFKSLTGIKMTNVSYKGTPQIVTALVSGEVSVGLPSTIVARPHVKSARLRGLAVTSAQRSPTTPDVPTVAEAGVPGYEASPWYGLMAPAGTPSEIMSRLHAESVRALKRQEVRERFGATDIAPIGSTPEQFGTYIQSEIVKWGKVVKASGVRPD